MDFTKYQNKAIFILVFLLVCFIGYNLVLKYNQTKIASVKEEIEKEKKKGELLIDISILDRKMKTFRSRSFPSTEITPLLDMITPLAKECGIAIETFSPRPLSHKEGFAYIPLEIPLRCGYHQVGKFISLLESNKELIRVQSVRLGKLDDIEGAGVGMLQVNLTLNGLYLFEE
ncbi:MAG: type 4a pilus biogenesis protein PilO [Candidatus Omnitrophica bacterium]|nr:type 4a pilus biogenesis protein PilO [Candidatus Omnitrophota bacterium]